MLGERAHFIRSFFLNPRVIIGFVLVFLTLQNEDKNWINLFCEATTYRNLALGSAVYVVLFGLKYTDGMKRVDFVQTLREVVKTMVVIAAVWFGTLFLINAYRQAGESYSELLRHRFQKSGWIKEDASDSSKTFREIKLELNEKYQITSDVEGHMVVENSDK